MLLRDATFEDLEALMPLAREAHLQSIFAGMEMNEAAVQRSFVTSIQFDVCFAKVIEKDGAVLGGLVGLVTENHFGIRCAVDLFNYSKGGTDLLIKSFMGWSEARGARFVRITDLSGNPRYQTLLTELGLIPSGINFVGVF
jgi:hypothetical protein